MSALIAAYRQPTAPLTRESAADVVEQLNELLTRLETLGIQQQLVDGVLTSIDNQQANTTPQATGRERVTRVQQRVTSGDAFLKATRICSGFGTEPVPDREANGVITLTIGITGETLDPVIWGTFDECRYLVGDSQVRLSGAENEPGRYSLYVGEGVPLRDFSVARVLFQLSLIAEVDGEAEQFDQDFYLDLETLEVESRIKVGDGYVLARAGVSQLGIKATNGDFGCDAAARTCDSGDQHFDL